MSIYQSTMFFECLGHGWSETYYRDAGGQSNLEALADFDRENLWKKRALCCGAQVAIVAQRVSFTDQLQDSVLNYLPLQVGTFDAEDSNTALLVTMAIANNTRRKNTFLRGVPDNIVVTGGIVDRAFAAFINAFNAFAGALVQNTYGWIGSDVKTEHPVTDYTSDATNRLVFTVGGAALPVPATGNKIRLRGKNLGVGGKSVLNRTAVFLRNSATECKTNKPTAAFPFSGPGGFLVSRTTTIRVIANVKIQKVVERKAGKVSFTSPGRVPARPLG